MNRTIGWIMTAAGIIAFFLIGALLLTLELSPSGRMLGFALFTAIIVLPLVGVGVFLVVRGGKEAAQMAEIKKQRELLGIIKAHGQIDIDEAVLNLGSTRDKVKEMLHDLVSKGLYSGYINWSKGQLYSSEASQLRDLENCKNCNGVLELAGKGVTYCPWCGTEYFLN